MEKRIIFVIALCLCLSLIQNVTAYYSKYHSDLTIDALRDEGVEVDRPQVRYIVVNNWMVDLISTAGQTNDKGEKTSDAKMVDDLLVPDVYLDSDAIEKLFDQRGHFQYINGFGGMCREWDRLQERTYQLVKRASQQQDRRAFLVTLGMSLHTVQDFYAHSNWADYQDNLFFYDTGYQGDVSWFDFEEKNKCTMSLGLNSLKHSELHKDYPTRPHFGTSYQQAYYASRQWIRLVRSWVGEDFWNYAMAENIDTASWGRLIDINGGEVPMDDFFMHVFWYSGTWSSDYSRATEGDVDFSNIYKPLNALGSTLMNFGSRYGFILSAERLESDHNYRRFYSIPEAIGWELYQTGEFPLNPEAHPETFERISEYRWLTIQTEEIHETDCDAVVDIDPGSAAEFYTMIAVNGHTYYEAPYRDADRVEPPGWVTLIPLPRADKSVNVVYSVWEDDAPWSDDDHCDINPEYGNKTWIGSIDVSDQSLSSSETIKTDGLRDCTRIMTSKGDGDEAYARFYYKSTWEKWGVMLWVLPPVQPIVRGTIGTYKIRIQNTGDYEDTFFLEIQGLQPNHYTLDRTSVTLQPNQTQDIPLHILTAKCPNRQVFTVKGRSETESRLVTRMIETEVLTIPPPRRTISPDRFESNDNILNAIPMVMTDISTSTRIPVYESRFDDLTLHQDKSGAPDQDYFKIQYPSPESIGCAAMQGLYIKEGIQGGVAVSINEEYCRPVDVTVYSPDSQVHKAFHAVDNFTVTCSELTSELKTPNNAILLSIRDPDNMGMRYNVTARYNEGAGKMGKPEEAPGLIGNFWKTWVSVTEFITSFFIQKPITVPQSLDVLPSPSVTTEIPVQGICDDNNKCTVNDRYSDRVCAGDTLNCDDGNPDTLDSCNPSTGCVFTRIDKIPLDNTPCSDGNSCTVNDYYLKGVCMGGQVQNCDDGNPDTIDSCNPSTGCVFTRGGKNPADYTPCDDGNLCSVNDYYLGGVCKSGQSQNCDDGNSQTNDSCDPARGCIFTPISPKSACPEPCECLYEYKAKQKFTTYTKCSESPCYIDTSRASALSAKYCFRPV